MQRTPTPVHADHALHAGGPTLFVNNANHEDPVNHDDLPTLISVAQYVLHKTI